MNLLKLPLLFTLLTALCIPLSCQAQSQNLRVATFNIRFDNPGDAPNHWDNRKEAVAKLIQFHEFDIFGSQEGLHHQVTELKDLLPGFDYVGVGRDDGKEKGEYTALFYNREKFTVMEQHTFWLSTDTSVPNKGWDAALPRICTWAKIKDKRNNEQFYVFNTHFDHVGVEARKQSAQLILEKIRELASGHPVILLGDFNVDQDNPAYQLLKDSKELKDSYEAAAIRYANNGTFNSFDLTQSSDRRIDHIFISPSLRVKKYGILTDTYHNRYPSDHFPVMAELEWK